MANTPKIRFAGFTDDWEQRKLSDLIIEYKETVDSDCTLPVLTSSKTEGVVLQEEHFGRVQNHDITGYNILPRNYCTYRNRSDGVDFTFNINRCCDKGIISKFYPVFYGNNSDIFFISMVLNYCDEVVHEIAYTCTGTGQKVLSFLDLQKMNIRVPSYDEQKKISQYFEQLDNLITLHQRKCDETKKLKKFMLQKMFPKKGEKKPDIRFEGFTDDWEQRKFGELYEVNNERNKDLIGYDKTFSIATMTYKGEGNGAADSSLSNYKVLRIGDIAFEGHTNKEFRYGRFVANDIGDGIMSPRFSALRPLFQMPVSFWKYYIHFEPIMKRKLICSTKAGTMMNELVTADFFEQSILVPSIDEQTKIGEFLSSLDNLITLHRRAPTYKFRRTYK